MFRKEAPMPDSSTLTLFVAASLALLITPGPAVIYIVARSIDQGRLAGIVSVLGISTGALLHVAAAALGISALLLSSALAFTAVKYLGAAYLIYLGIRTLLRPDHAAPDAGPPAQRELSRIYAQGVVVNALNPKAALFFFAFLPQFVNPALATSVTAQILLLGCLFVVLGFCSDGVYALLAGSLGHWLRHNLRFMSIQRYLSSSIYIALGIGTALSGGARK
jgi:threonine/homoserine/homoserine lactone efflux protein